MPTTFGGRIMYILEQYSGSFVRGAANTMIIALISTFIGCITVSYTHLDVYKRQL